jgi:tellurite resistance protein TehA-like permease
MGTGITSILLYTLPYQFRGLKTIATIIFFLNLVLFLLFLAMSM